MVMHKTTEQAEAGVAPGAELVAGMGRLIHEMTMAGVLLAAEGLLPSSEGVRVSFAGDRRTVVDGPFAEPSELIAGFALIEVRSKEEAIEWTSRFAEVVGDAEVELRRVAEAPDVASTP